MDVGTSTQNADTERATPILGQFQSMNQQQWEGAVQTFLKYKAATR